MQLKHFPITSLLPIIVGLLVTIALVAALLGSTRTGNRIIEKSAIDSGRTMMSTLSLSLFNDLYTLDIDAINVDLRGFTREDNVVHAAVRDRTGQVVAEASDGWSPEERVSQNLSAEAFGQREIVHRNIGRYLILSSPITAGSEGIGTLEIVFDKSSLQASLESEQRQLLFLIIGLLITTLVTIAMIIRYAIKPLGTLAASAREIGAGNLDTSVPVSGSKEMVMLAGVMDQMRANLKQLYSRLEQRVVERTRELSMANQQLSRSNQDLQQFANIASHDLQEPLRMVSSYAQLLESRYKDQLDSDAMEFIEYVVDGAKRMQAQIKDLLEYSRLTKQGIPFVPTDCSEVFDQAVSNLSVTIEESAVTMTNDPLPTVIGDKSQLVSVFQNLIANGIKYQSGQNPRIHVSAINDEGQWLFSFQDNGIGIEAQHLERVFVIFQRLNGREEYSGTGIGLAICKKVIEVHGGHIWVESEPGEGSTFYFTLPNVLLPDPIYPDDDHIAVDELELQTE